MEVNMMVTSEAVRRVKRQSKCHHQQTNIRLFYRPDALPIAQPTTSKQWWAIYEVQTLPVIATRAKYSCIAMLQHWDDSRSVETEA